MSTCGATPASRRQGVRHRDHRSDRGAARFSPAALLEHGRRRSSKRSRPGWPSEESWRRSGGWWPWTGYRGSRRHQRRLPEAVAVMDPFASCAWALTRWSSSAAFQLDTCGHRGRRAPILSTPRGGYRRPAKTCSPISNGTGDHTVRRRCPRQSRSDLGHLSAHDRRLPQPRPPGGCTLMSALIGVDQRAVPAALTEVITLGRTLKNAPRMCWPTSTGPAPPTDPPKPSTADWNTCAAPPWDFGISPTT